MERNQALVIDASVALKWFVEEEQTNKAQEVLDYVTDKAIPIVPSLFFYEISNVLRYKPEFGIKDIKEVLIILAYGIEKLHIIRFI